MSTWRSVELKTLVQEHRGISYGIVQPGRPTTDGVPIVRVSDVRNGRIDTSAPLRVDPRIESSYERTRLQGGELLITVVGTIGQTAIVPTSMTGWNVARAIAVLPIQKEVGAYWVKLALRSSAAQHMMQSHLNTTVQPTLNLAVVAKLPIVLPPRLPRQRISSILGSYDTLVESNRRRISLLEEMASRVFEEWCVHERVPRQSVSAFTTMPLGEIADVQWGDTRTTKASYVDKGYAAYSASGPDGLLDHFDHDGPGIVLSAIGAQCGRIWLALSRWSAIKNTIIIKARAGKTTAHLLYLALNKDGIWPKRGAAQPFISQGDARKIPIRLPPIDVQKELDNIVAPMLDSCYLLRAANETLTRSRDLLLPRLLSGQLSVSTVEHEFEAVA